MAKKMDRREVIKGTVASVAALAVGPSPVIPGVIENFPADLLRINLSINNFGFHVGYWTSVDTSDIPEVGEDWFKQARLVNPA